MVNSGILAASPTGPAAVPSNTVSPAPSRMYSLLPNCQALLRASAMPLKSSVPSGVPPACVPPVKYSFVPACTRNPSSSLRANTPLMRAGYCAMVS